MKFSRLHPQSALLIALSGFVAGCFDDLGVSRFKDIPHVGPHGVQFADRDPSSGLRGTVIIDPAIDGAGTTDSDKWTFDTYALRWGDDAGNPLPDDGVDFRDSSFIGYAYRFNEVPTFELDAIPPPGATSIVVRTSNALGESTESAWIAFENVLVNPSAPTVHPRDVRFTDITQNLGISGYVYFKKPQSGEAGITRYVVRYADSNGCVLRGDALGGIRADNRNSDYSFVIASTWNIAPPANAASIAVVAANGNDGKDEAWSPDCAYSHSNPAQFNEINPSKTPYYAAQRVIFHGDNDETRTIEGDLEIQPSKDERDLSTGYYVDLASKQNAQWNTPSNKYLPKTGGTQTYHINGFRPDLGVIFVGTGDHFYFNNARLNLRLDLEKENKIGSWYIIRNSMTQECLSVTGETSALNVQPCDEYNVNQRFFVTSVTSPDDPNSDDYFVLEPQAFPGMHVYRPYGDGVGYLKLRSKDLDGWESRIQLKSFGKSEVAAPNYNLKKMAFVNKVDIIYHFACASTLGADEDINTPNEVQTPWSNCSGIPVPQNFSVITNFIEWEFQHANGSINQFNNTKNGE